jgi:hypothetical protein
MAVERISKDIRADVARMSDLLKTVNEDPARLDALVARPAEVLAGLGIELEKYASKAVPAAVIADQVALTAVHAIQGMMLARIKDMMDSVAETSSYSETHTWSSTRFTPNTRTRTRSRTHVGSHTKFDGLTLVNIRDMQLQVLVSPQAIQELEAGFETILVESRNTQQLQAGHG